VTAGLDTTVRVWEVETGKALFLLPGHSKNVLFAGFSPNGKRVVTAGDDRKVTVWEIPAAK
jgi:WD40 repeat protein